MIQSKFKRTSLLFITKHFSTLRWMTNWICTFSERTQELQTLKSLTSGVWQVLQPAPTSNNILSFRVSVCFMAKPASSSGSWSVIREGMPWPEIPRGNSHVCSWSAGLSASKAPCESSGTPSTTTKQCFVRVMTFQHRLNSEGFEVAQNLAPQRAAAHECLSLKALCISIQQQKTFGWYATCYT